MKAEKISRIFVNIMLALFVLLISAALIMRLADFQYKSYIAAFIASLGLFIIWSILKRKIRPDFLSSFGRFKTGLVLSIVFLLINLTYIYFVRLEPSGDYSTFWKTAVDMAQGAELRSDSYVALFPHILGYSAFLSVFLRVFGESLMTAAVLNVLLGLISGIIIYYLGCRIKSTEAGAFAFLLWICCPSEIMYNSMVISEPYYTCLLLCFVLLIFTLGEKKGKKTAGLFALGGIAGALLLAGVNTARPIAAIPIIAFFIWLLFLRGEGLKDKKMWKNYLAFALALLFFYSAAGKLWENYAETLVNEPLPDSPGYSVYVGFNTETQGSYSDEDMQTLQDLRYNVYGNAREAQAKISEEAAERIGRIKPGELISLFAAKLKTLLGDDQAGAYYTFQNSESTLFPIFATASNVFYYFLLLLSLSGAAGMAKKGEKSAILLVPLYVIGLSLAHMLVEVAGRYHYSIIPMLIITAVFSLFNKAGRAEKKSL